MCVGVSIFFLSRMCEYMQILPEHYSAHLSDAITRVRVHACADACTYCMHKLMTENVLIACACVCAYAFAAMSRRLSSFLVNKLMQFIDMFAVSCGAACAESA